MRRTPDTTPRTLFPVYPMTTSAERVGAMRERRAERDLCQDCGERQRAEHALRCEECLAKIRAKYRAKHPQLSTRHSCTGCGARDHNRRTCPVPEMRRMSVPSNSERSQTARDRRLLAKLCVDCGRAAPKPGRQRCARCLEIHLERYRQRPPRRQGGGA